MPYTVRFTCTSSWAFTSITIIVVIGSISIFGEFFIIGYWPGECSDARMLANRPKPETELPPGAFHDDHHHDCGDDDHYCDDREIIMTK